MKKFAHLASPEEIIDNGYNLNIPHYAELAGVRAMLVGYLSEKNWWRIQLSRIR